MTELVVCMTDDTGFKHLNKLISENEWERVFIVTNDSMVEKIDIDGEVNLVLIDPKKPTTEIVKTLFSNLKGKIKGLEVALNIFSGTGKEHMAILSALLKMGVGIRLVMQGDGELKEV
jgi:hypothetical protein